MRARYCLRPPQMKVLIVEDDHSILELLSTVFRRAGLDFESAADGAAAIRKLRSVSYDVILLDLMLPLVNGFEVLREMRSFAPWLRNRTIVLTAAADATLRDFDRSEVFALIRKPFDLQKLLGEIKACGEQQSLDQRPRSYSMRLRVPQS